MSENRARWDTTLDALEALYKDVERRSFSLPTFSLSPFVIGSWNYIKFGVFLYIDLLLLPLNAIIFLRNLFFQAGGATVWSSGRYWKYTINWLWRGEAPAFPFAVIRPLVMFMGNVHAHSRFRAVERAIYLDDMLTEEERTDLNKKIAAALEHWRRPTMVQVVYTYALPVVGLLINVYKSFFPSQLSPWVGFVGLLLLSYALGFVLSAFMFKRSLMLGASGRAIYFPGAISGNQGYGTERAIHESVGINTREWPFDIALAFILLPIGFLSYRSESAFYKSLGVSFRHQAYDPGVVLLVQSALLVMLIVLALYRRRITGRS